LLRGTPWPRDRPRRARTVQRGGEGGEQQGELAEPVALSVVGRAAEAGEADQERAGRAEVEQLQHLRRRGDLTAQGGDLTAQGGAGWRRAAQGGRPLLRAAPNAGRWPLAPRTRGTGLEAAGELG
jgi:hypothetical protein